MHLEQGLSASPASNISLPLAESLRARLQELRARRADLEKIREEVIKHLKNIHNRITLRRKEGRERERKRDETSEKRVSL